MSEISEDVLSGDDGKQDGDEVVEFGWDEDKPVTGRRKKAAKAKKIKPGSFESMGLSTSVLQAIKRKGFRLPTPIQRKALPRILQGADVVAMARTGSGKTAAFVIPMIQKLQSHSPKAGARALILAPTRELTLQTFKVVRELSRYSDLRMAVLVGGDALETQFAELAMNPDILVATPGRLLHHLAEVEGMSLRAVEYVVFDEADRLFEMGFADQVRSLLSSLSPSRQTLLFSATLPKQLAEFAQAGLHQPQLIRLDTDTKISPDLTMAFFAVRSEDKPAALLHLLRSCVKAGESSLVFVCTRHHVELLHQLLEREGLESSCVYGAMDQTARKIHVSKFRARKVGLMIVTDVAARGIDLPLLDNVINYDFPATPKLFVHRVGRVARAGRLGCAFSLVTRGEVPYLLDLHLFLSRPLTTAPDASLQEAAAAAASLDASTSLLGNLPQAVLADPGERVSALLSSSLELQALLKSSSNAYQLYLRTRPPASPHSLHRAKELGQLGPHPVLAASLPPTSLTGLEAREEAAAITQQLRQFRPAHTVFEAEVAANRRGQGAGLGAGPNGVSGPAELVEVMRDKRVAHSAAIQQERKRIALKGAWAQGAGGGEGGGAEGVGRDNPDEAERDEGGAGAVALQLGDEEVARFRDTEFYIPMQRADRHVEEGYSVGGHRGGALAAAVVEVGGDEAADMRRQQAAYHWDNRKRRYIKLQADEVVRGGKRYKSESGAKVASKEGAGQLYKKWTAKQKLRVAPTGDSEHDTPALQGLGNRFRKGGRGWVNPLKSVGVNKDAREELKSAGQVRKQRRDEERKGQHMKARGKAKAGGGKKGRRKGK